jgi:hypothetical protein
VISGAWVFFSVFKANVPNATTDTPGIVQLATPEGSVDAGDNERVVTPAGLAYFGSVRLTNPNLLHNWDMRNPVNQRGQTFYNVALGQYNSIDRYIGRGGVSLEIVSGGIKITKTSMAQGAGIVQPIEFFSSLLGKTVTSSFDISEINVSGSGSIMGGCWFADAAHGLTDVIGFSRYNTVGMNSNTANIPLNTSRSRLHFGVAFAEECQIGDYFVLKRVKLELGSVSTLANDVPMDYGRELAVCQRYQLALSGTNLAVVATANTIFCQVPLPTSLRINPTLVNPSGIILQHSGMDAPNAAGFSNGINRVSQNAVLISMHQPNHGYEVNSAKLAAFNNVILDANL